MRNHLYLLFIITSLFTASCGKKDEYSTKVNPYQPVPVDTVAQQQLSAGIYNLLYPYGGLNRKFMIQLPAGFNAQKTYPVVFAFHGVAIPYTGWQELVGAMIDSREYIGIYPAAVDSAFNFGISRFSAIDDTGYINRIVYWLRNKTNVKTDPARYYATGMGTGSAFVHYLALHTRLFAAIAPVSGSPLAGMMQQAGHNGHTPVLQLHGDPDDGILYNGGAGSLGASWEAAQSTMRLWAARNYCGNAPRIDTVAQGSLIRYRYPVFVGAEESSLYVLPGVTDVYGAADRSLLNALIWDFFGRH
jgi:poly(3-hydroxybutyrate) depolymerase